MESMWSILKLHKIGHTWIRGSHFFCHNQMDTFISNDIIIQFTAFCILCNCTVYIYYAIALYIPCNNYWQLHKKRDWVTGGATDQTDWNSLTTPLKKASTVNCGAYPGFHSQFVGRFLASTVNCGANPGFDLLKPLCGISSCGPVFGFRDFREGS